jgi:hypothetical protein
MEMKKDFVEMVFILDRSGSMGGLEKETIGGFNAMIEKQKHVEGEALVSTILFNHDIRVLHSRNIIKEIKTMTKEEYFVGGTTALLDAIGRSIHEMVSIHKDMPEEHRPEKVIFVITTDGMENASRKYSYDSIRSLIHRQKEKYGWEFIFLGANLDAIHEANKLGIKPDRATRFHSDKQGTSLNYEVMNEAIQELRIKKSISNSWKDRIDADFKKRDTKDTN